jgi:hypothetical protein
VETTERLQRCRDFLEEMPVCLLSALLLWDSKVHHHNRLLLEGILSSCKARFVDIHFDITVE